MLSTEVGRLLGEASLYTKFYGMGQSSPGGKGRMQGLWLLEPEPGWESIKNLHVRWAQLSPLNSEQREGKVTTAC